MTYFDPRSFTDRMEQGKAIAQELRNRGRSIGNGKVKLHKAPIEDNEINRLYAELADLRSDLADARNTINVMKMNGANDVELIDVPFDADPENAPAPTLADRRRLSQPSSTPAARRSGGTWAMTTQEYAATLEKLKMKPAARSTAAALGLSVRQCQRIAAGAAPVTGTLALLLTLLLKSAARGRRSS